MAKSKKEIESKPPKAASKKSAKKADKLAAPSDSPMINTDLAAANAARMLFASTRKSGEQPSRSGGLIDQLKADLHKPAASSMASLLDKTGGSAGNQSNLPHTGPQKQVGRNQTFGADVNRSYVPRRTGGG